MGVVSGMLSPGSDTLYTLCTIESPQWPQWAANDHGVAGAGHYMVTPSLPVMIQGVQRYADNITQGKVSHRGGTLFISHVTLY